MYDLWQKRVLIPFWILTLIVYLAFIVLAAFSIAAVHIISDDDYRYYINTPTDYDDPSGRRRLRGVSSAIYIILGVFIGIAVVGVIFQIVEIVQFARKRLSPVLLVVFNALGTTVWVILLILGSIGAAQSSAIGILFPILLTALHLGKLIYASVILHRVRKGRAGARGTYAAPPTAGQVETGYTGGATTYDSHHNNGAAPIGSVPKPAGANGDYYAPENVGYGNGRV